MVRVGQQNYLLQVEDWQRMDNQSVILLRNIQDLLEKNHQEDHQNRQRRKIKDLASRSHLEWKEQLIKVFVKSRTNSRGPKNNSTPKSRIIDYKVDVSWQEILERNNLNVKEINLQNQRPEERALEVIPIWPISPLSTPNVTISPRKFQSIEETEANDEDLSPILRFNIDKFLDRIRERPEETLPRRSSSPTLSEISTSFTYPIGRSYSGSNDDTMSTSTPYKKRLRKIKKSLLDLQSPPSSTNSSICRVLNDCFDSYIPMDGGADKRPLTSCFSSVSDNWRLSSSPEGVERVTDGNKNLRHFPVLQKVDKICQTEYQFCNWPEEQNTQQEQSRTNTSSRSIRDNKSYKDLQRSLLESDPKFKKVVDDIRKESEDVLRRSSMVAPTIQHPYHRREELTVYKTCCTSLSTGMSDLALESDFTECNSDVLLCPSSSLYDSM